MEDWLKSPQKLIIQKIRVEMLKILYRIGVYDIIFKDCTRFRTH